ncbi:MAG: ATP-binding protein [Clostridia bacterium]|nr:ATP-binding protein [Clostridia bacterium]
MQRKIYEKLKKWKDKGMKKPLMIIGARQVGKTYIVEQFCKNEFENYISINLLDHPEIAEIYKQSISSEEKYIRLCAELNINPNLEETIIFFDEIQESEELISALKWFCESDKPFKIICAGSLLGVKLKRFHSSFPVGKVEMLNMYPMDFEEFLSTQNSGEYLINYIKDCYEKNSPMDNVMHEKLLNLYRMYLCVGGMPEVVEDFVSEEMNILKINRELIEDIVNSYINDMNKYVNNKYEAAKNESIYRSIPVQIGNKSNKFQYTKIEKNARKRDYESSMDWLLSSSMIYKCCKLSSINIPPEAYKDNDYFKIYMGDIGILNTMLKINTNEIYLDKSFIYKGEIAENYVANQLIFNNIPVYYWATQSNSEIDFIIYNEDGIIPIEVKAGEKTQSKSLNAYINKYKPKYSIRISAKNFGFENGIKSVPLYATYLIK